MDLQGKTALITGAARGIGQAIACEFAAAGAAVVGVDLSLAHLPETQEKVERLGRRFTSLQCDIADQVQVRDAIKRAWETSGGFDILVNNAGVLAGGLFVDRDFEAWRKMIDVNLTGLMAFTHAALPYLVQRESAHIVNIASIAGKFGPEGVAAYAASKHGVVGFSSALRFELRSRNIGVSCICPSQVQTRLSEGVTATFLTPIMQPQDVARAVRKAIEKNLAEVYVPGSQRFIVSIIPSLLPRFARWFARVMNVSRGWLNAGKEIPK